MTAAASKIVTQLSTTPALVIDAMILDTTLHQQLTVAVLVLRWVWVHARSSPLNTREHFLTSLFHTPQHRLSPGNGTSLTRCLQTRSSTQLSLLSLTQIGPTIAAKLTFPHSVSKLQTSGLMFRIAVAGMPSRPFSPIPSHGDDSLAPHAETKPPPTQL